MAYEKQVWNTGDIITKDKLNHIENGIKNGENLILSITTEEREENGFHIVKYILNATYNEMINTIRNGGFLGILATIEEDGTFAYEFSAVPKGMEPFQVIDSESAGMPLGYYFPYEIGNEDTGYFARLLYSETPDGVMSYEEGNEK